MLKLSEKIIDLPSNFDDTVVEEYQALFIYAEWKEILLLRARDHTSVKRKYEI